MTDCMILEWKHSVSMAAVSIFEERKKHLKIYKGFSPENRVSDHAGSRLKCHLLKLL